MMTKLDGYMHTSSLDMNIVYYHIELSPGSKNYMYQYNYVGKLKVPKVAYGGLQYF